MLKIIQAGNSLPFSYPCDPTSTFQPGQVAQLKIYGQDIVAGLSDGTAPLGIIDDIRTSAFTQPVIDEIVIIHGSDVYTDGYNFFNGKSSKQELNNAAIVSSSFIADYEGLILNPTNGILTLPEDSLLNWDADGDRIPDSVKTVVSYVYQVPSLPGDDTTIGSNRLTIWFQRGIFATDQFDTLQRYAVNTTLFVNEEGKFTSKQITQNHPGVALCLAPPSMQYNTIELLWL